MLPATLTGTLVASDESGRMLVLSETMIAAMSGDLASEADYAAWERVECNGLFACRVQANGCEGTISREPDTSVVLAFAATVPAEAGRCASYSGHFVPGAENEVARVEPYDGLMPAPPLGRVVMGRPSADDNVDLDKAQRYAEALVEGLEDCYREHLREQDATTTGVVHVSVSSKKGAELQSSTLDAPELELCVRRRFSGFARMRTKHGTPTTVHYVASFVRH